MVGLYFFIYLYPTTAKPAGCFPLASRIMFLFNRYV